MSRKIKNRKTFHDYVLNRGILFLCLLRHAKGGVWKKSRYITVDYSNGRGDSSARISKRLRW